MLVHGFNVAVEKQLEMIDFYNFFIKKVNLMLSPSSLVKCDLLGRIFVVQWF